MSMVNATPWVGGGRRRWSITGDMLATLQADFVRLANAADHDGGYVTAYLSGEPDAPSIVPNIDGQRLIGQLKDMKRVLTRADVVSDLTLAVIGRTVTLKLSDNSEVRYTLVIPGSGDPSAGRVSVESLVGSAIYLRRVGERVSIDAPAGAWGATLVAVE